MKIIITEQQLENLMDQEKDISDLIFFFFLSYTFPKCVAYFEVLKEGLGYDVKFYINPKGFNNSQYRELYDLFYEIKESFLEIAPFNTIISFKWAVNKG